MVDGENLFPVFASTNPRERRNGVPQGARRAVAYARANLALMRFFRGDDCYPGLGRLLPGSETFRYPGVGDDYYPGQRDDYYPGPPSRHSRWHVKKTRVGTSKRGYVGHALRLILGTAGRPAPRATARSSRCTLRKALPISTTSWCVGRKSRSRAAT